MAEVVIMPKLGFNMDHGKLVKWHKKEGESIVKGETLFEVETDKTTIEIQATSNGVVKKVFIDEDNTMPVTLPIAIIAEDSEDISSILEECYEKLAIINVKRESPVEEKKNLEKQTELKADYDLAVIGAGPGGYVAAIRAAQKGKKVCIIEKNKIGGVCLNEGCIPTKTFIKSVEIMKNVKRAESFGVINVNNNIEVDMDLLQKRKNEIVKKLTKGVESLLKGNKVEIIKSSASFVDRNTLKIDDKTIKAENIILATGSKPFIPPIDISKDAPVITSSEVLDLNYIPKSVVIIGGGVIGIEFAYILAHLGTKITVIEMLDRILPMIDDELIKQVTKQLNSVGINIITGAKVKEINNSSVIYEIEQKDCSIQAEKVLISVGRKANTDGLNLETIGIELEKGAVKTNDFLRTNIEGIYAIGDVNGKSMLAHTASMEGIIAVENICGSKKVMNYSTIPSCIYLNPEIASVGLTEKEALNKNKKLKIGRFPLAANGKALVEGETNGIIKVIIDEKLGEILGAHILGAHATDIISEIVVAMNSEATVEEMAYSIHPHPTISEIVNEAFNAALSKPIHFI